MDRVLVCFDNLYFSIFGIAWLASIRELGQFKGPIYAATFEPVNMHITKVLEEENVHLIPCFDKPKTRESALEVLPISDPGSFVFWDIDGYFAKPIQPIFDKIADKLLFTKNAGFIAGNSFSWKTITDYNRLNDYCGFAKKLDVSKYFPDSIVTVDESWNFCYPNRALPDNVVFVHFAGEVKKVSSLFIAEDLLFADRHVDIYKKWESKFQISTNKKFIMRKTKNE